jgi:hypothetical protein
MTTMTLTFAAFEARVAAVGDPPFSLAIAHAGGDAAAWWVFLRLCTAYGMVYR